MSFLLSPVIQDQNMRPNRVGHIIGLDEYCAIFKRNYHILPSTRASPNRRARLPPPNYWITYLKSVAQDLHDNAV